MSGASVVIPCFDLGRYLPEAVESVLSQTHPPADLVVVDDGSTDPDTLDVLRRYADDGVTVLRTQNRGAPAARNRGISATTGEYVVCLDADDVLMPTYIERTIDALEESTEAGIAATGVEFFGSTTGTWRPPPFSLARMLAQNCVPSASLFRRTCWEQVGGYSDLEACQDWDLWLSIVERGWRWVVVDDVLYRYRRRPGSLSERRDAKRAAVLGALLERHRATYDAHWQEAILELDGELQRLRRRSRDQEDVARRRRESVEALRTAVAEAVPERATVMVVSHGDDEALQLPGRTGWHVPQADGGAYAGHHPADSEAAIAHVEELRALGGEFIAVPPACRWWLDYYDGLREHLEERYPVVSAPGSDCVIYDVTEYHRFSVVICTYRRAELLGRALQSVFEQNYPRSHFDVLVVDNDSPDDTKQVIAEWATRSPVPFSSFVERRNGLSHARNLGVACARGEYVAFLDDDAAADPGWLRAFNRVINREHALVVGGGVDKAFPDGLEPPRWFDDRYLRHFFGVDYREPDGTDRVFRIRYPQYLTGANLAYARRLFERFGGFDTRLGRDGNSLLAGEESYLNLILDRADVPIYYTDEARVEHFVGTDRVSRRHLARKAWWSGVSNAVLHTLAFGPADASTGARGNLRDARRLAALVVRRPRDQETFARVCRGLHHLAFGTTVVRLTTRAALGSPLLPSADSAAWGRAEWIAEVDRWLDGRDKYETLAALHGAYGDAESAARARATAERYHLGASDSGEAPRWGPLERDAYRRLVSRLRQAVRATVPSEAVVAVVSRGDEELVHLDGCRARHFPESPEGHWIGHHPAGSDEAIAHLESALERGTEFLLFPQTSLWWLDYYEEFSRQLDRCGTVILDESWGRLFRLRSDAEARREAYGDAQESAPALVQA